MMPRITSWEMGVLMRLWHSVPRMVWADPAMLLPHLLPYFGQARAQQLIDAGVSTPGVTPVSPTEVDNGVFG
jgi:hypothetical protein